MSNTMMIVIMMVVLLLALLIVAIVLKRHMDGVLVRRRDDELREQEQRDKSQDQMMQTLKVINDVQDKRLEEMGRQINKMSIENEMKLDNIRSTLETRLNSLQAENGEQLEKMRETVDEKLQKTLEERLSKSFQIVNEQLNQVNKSFGEMQAMAQDVGDLKRVLSNVKTRGNLGEMQLGAILEEILSMEQYDENVVTVPGTQNRVEYAVKLPGDNDGTVYLPIDAKFPADRYEDLLDAYESGEKEQVEIAKKALVQIIKQEAKDIRQKYVAPPYTTDFAVMFLPVEGLYAEAVKLGLVEELQKDEFKINIAGPTTMAALLNSLQMGFRTLAIQKHSSEVWEILSGVKTEFQKFADALAKVQQRLGQADDELEKLVGTRTRQINRKLKKVEALKDYEGESLIEAADTIDEEDEGQA